MNNRCGFWMEHHTTKVKERCRVCGRFLVEARETKKRSSYLCQEFAAHLYAVFAINTCNDTPITHPQSFCYHCKLVLDNIMTEGGNSQHHQSNKQRVCCSWWPICARSGQCPPILWGGGTQAAILWWHICWKPHSQGTQRLKLHVCNIIHYMHSHLAHKHWMFVQLHGGGG